ncbi:zinc finger BED domain-containing protein RICESLEEPER 2-like protein [Tanacetum coccineum]
MTLESNSVNQTPVEVESSETEEEEEQPKGQKKRSLVWIDFEELKLKKGETPIDKKAMCKNCGKTYLCHSRKHSNTNLKNHLLTCTPYLAKQSTSLNNITFEGGDAKKMTAWKFDKKSKEALAHMIVVDELPFSLVENSGFRYYQKINQPLFDVPCRGEWLHIRCAAHVVNLVVQDGIKHVGRSIESIRCAIKWIKKSGTRIEKFNKCARSARCDSTKKDVDFGLHIVNKGHSVPTSKDWVKAKKLCHFLKTFYDITLRISGTKYVTSHTLVNELAIIHARLREQLDCDIHDEAPTDKHLYDIAKVMKPKFEKYYGEGRHISFGKKKDYIKGKMKLLYEDYVRIHAPSSTSSSTLGKRPRNTNTSNELDHGDMLRRRMKIGQSSSSSSSELDKYNGEFCEPFDKNVNFGILLWCKVNSTRFPILSLMTRDLLAIPISTMDLESIGVYHVTIGVCCRARKRYECDGVDKTSGGIVAELVGLVRSKVVSDVGKHVVDSVLKHADFMPSGATTLAKHVVKVRHVI